MGEHLGRGALKVVGLEPIGGLQHRTETLTVTESTVDGDLVICLPLVLREAAEQDKAVPAHFAHLIVHGMLHLLGYDHEGGAREAQRMELREREILAGLGYPDPYH